MFTETEFLHLRDLLFIIASQLSPDADIFLTRSTCYIDIHTAPFNQKRFLNNPLPQFQLLDFATITLSTFKGDTLRFRFDPIPQPTTDDQGKD